MYVNGRCQITLHIHIQLRTHISRAHTYIHFYLHAGIRFFFFEHNVIVYSLTHTLCPPPLSTPASPPLPPLSQ